MFPNELANNTGLRISENYKILRKLQGCLEWVVSCQMATQYEEFDICARKMKQISSESYH